MRKGRKDKVMETGGRSWGPTPLYRPFSFLCSPPPLLARPATARPFIPQLAYFVCHIIRASRWWLRERGRGPAEVILGGKGRFKNCSCSYVAASLGAATFSSRGGSQWAPGL